ncbi:hypothetical protein HN937_27480, partial [Candidatus Poribacteria bacterium]|nr:hypothetical protein [Candidatus Poribacteria bacterium]
LAADASADWAWATQHGVFGGLVRLVPSERAITPVEGVPAPEALAVSPVDGTLWAVDTDTDTVFAVSRDGRLIRELHSLRRPLTVGVRPEGGVWVGCADTLVKLDDDGDVMAGIELGRAFTHLDVDLRDDSVWALLDGPRELVRVTTDMEVAHRVGAPGARFVVAAPATGGCWVAMDDRVVHVNDEGRVSARAVGYVDIVWLSRNPSDDTTWVMDNSGDRLSKLPVDENEAIFAVSGFGSGSDDGLRMARRLAIRLVVTARILDTPPATPAAETEGDEAWRQEPEGNTPAADASPPATSSTLPDAVRAEPEAVSPAESNDALTPPDREDVATSTPLGAVGPEADASLAEPPSAASDSAVPDEERTDPSARPEPVPGSVSPADAADAATQPTDAPPSSAAGLPAPVRPGQPHDAHTPPGGEDATRDTMPDAAAQMTTGPPSQAPDLPEPIDIMPDPSASVLFVKLAEGLSTQRVRNNASALGRRYVWNFDEETYTLLVGVDIETYNRYANRERSSLADIVREDVVAMAPLSQEFHALADRKGWRADTLASFVLAFAQSLPYTVDKATTGYDEFFAYGYETLVAGGGDCEDTTILASAMLLGMGYQVALLNPPGHLALGVGGDFGGSFVEHGGIRYFFCESTGTGWRVGEVPDAYQGKAVRVITITP